MRTNQAGTLQAGTRKEEKAPILHQACKWPVILCVNRWGAPCHFTHSDAATALPILGEGCSAPATEGNQQILICSSFCTPCKSLPRVLRILGTQLRMVDLRIQRWSSAVLWLLLGLSANNLSSAAKNASWWQERSILQIMTDVSTEGGILMAEHAC
jgi:hypothetical protein